MSTNHQVREAVRERYATFASDDEACCSTDPVTVNLYSASDLQALPMADPAGASLGCGNPTALAELSAGEVVLDLGSGAGLDVFLAAQRVGPTGKAYGVDMTDEMLTRARSNQGAMGFTNVEFLKGYLEALPLPDNSVDVIISNCVINLAADKDIVLAEAFRVLRPGGRVTISDVVVDGDVPDALRRDMGAWAGCISGALTIDDYTQKLGRAGFGDVVIETTRTYQLDEVAGSDSWKSLEDIPESDRAAVVSRFTSSLVRAGKKA